MNIITDIDALNEMVSAYMEQDAFAYDVETIGDLRLLTKVNDVAWIALSTEGRTDVIPMGHPNGEFLDWKKPLLLAGKRRVEEGKPITEAHFSKDQRKWVPLFDDPPAQLRPGTVFAALKPLMFSDKIKVGHNLKFDLNSVAKYYRGEKPTGPYFDTVMAQFIIDNRNRGQLGLKASVQRELGIEIEKGVGEDISKHSFSEVAKYAGIDAEVTWKLYKALAPRIKGNLRRVWKLEMDVLNAVCDMELHGAYIDQEQLQVVAKKLEEDKETAIGRVYKAAGTPFPINSTLERQKHLFGAEEGKKPRIQPKVRNQREAKVKLTPQGQNALARGDELNFRHYSVSADALAFYAGKDALVDGLLEYAEMAKLMSTYVLPYTGGEVTRYYGGKPKTTVRKSILINGMVHTNFKAHGAETGRFSSSEPNLQNIPSSGENGKLIRNLFCAPPGHKLVVADYSQIEPRVIASLAKDRTLIDNYNSGGDIYTTVGDSMGVDRKAGKVLVLAISYGVGPDKIAESIGCTVTEAKKLLNDFENTFKSIPQFKKEVILKAKERRPIPYVETLFGRRRYIPELNSKEMGLLGRAERQAFNTVIQGSAADIMKLALVRAHSCFTDEPDINVILTVHDELVTVCPEDRADDTLKAVRESMEGIKLDSIKVPLVADATIVDRWGEAK